MPVPPDGAFEIDFGGIVTVREHSRQQIKHVGDVALEYRTKTLLSAVGKIDEEFAPQLIIRCWNNYATIAATKLPFNATIHYHHHQNRKFIFQFS